MQRAALLAVLVFCACAEDPAELLDGDAAVLADAAAADAELTDAESSDAGAADAELADAGELACEPPAATAAGEVRTRYSTLRGTERGDTYAYLGVRYASPPVGELRLRAPVAPACERELREASAFGASCPQFAGDPAAPSGDEDCLTLNIWAPKIAPSEPRPVLFFIHGGGNNQGSSSAQFGASVIYDGQQLAELGNIVVTINYRLGALAWAAHPLLDAEAENNLSGNYGLRDQIAALEWVRDNISQFGGDPQRVMIFGESAGGVNVCALFGSPAARGLFSRALIESGGCTASPKTVGVEVTNRLFDALSCSAAADPLACVRSKTPAEILNALPPQSSLLVSSEFGPIVDGEILPFAPRAALVTEGAHANVPFILGSNKDETYLGLPPPMQLTTQMQFDQAARMFLLGASAPPAKIPDILAVYPLSDYGDSAHAALVALTTDWRWSCAGRGYLRALYSNTTAPLYRYYFTKSLDPMRAPVLSRAGAYHGLELFYVFGSLTTGAYMPTAADLELSAQMQRYWSRFAATGDPNGEADPLWPQYDATTDPHIILGESISEGTGVRQTQCDALELILR